MKLRRLTVQVRIIEADQPETSMINVLPHGCRSAWGVWKRGVSKPWKGGVTCHAGPALHAISLSNCFPCCLSLGDPFDKRLHLLLVNAVNIDGLPEPCNNE